MRELSKGHDGWYYEGQRIEDPTNDEITAWHNRFCPYCSMGTISIKEAVGASEWCEHQVPCPVCQGSGMKDGRLFQYVRNFKASVGPMVLDKDTFESKRHVTIEFDYMEPSQQDGRPPKESSENYKKAYQIGWCSLYAMQREGK